MIYNPLFSQSPDFRKAQIDKNDALSNKFMVEINESSILKNQKDELI